MADLVIDIEADTTYAVTLKVRYKIARIFGVPPWVLFGPPGEVRRRRERLRRMHQMYRERR